MRLAALLAWAFLLPAFVDETLGNCPPSPGLPDLLCEVLGPLIEELGVPLTCDPTMTCVWLGGLAGASRCWGCCDVLT